MGEWIPLRLLQLLEHLAVLKKGELMGVGSLDVLFFSSFFGDDGNDND